MMTDEQVDDFLASLAVTQADVESLDLEAELAELRDSIMTRPGAAAASASGGQRLRRPGRWAAAAAAVAASLALVMIQPFGGTGGGAWAEPLIRAAERAPRLLIDAPGWTVVRADIYGEEGEATFANGDATVDLHWRDGDAIDQYLSDRADSAVATDTREVLGHPATMFLYNHQTNDRTTLFHDGQFTIEIRGAFENQETYLRVLDQIATVDVDTWLSAMPDSVVNLGQRPATVRAMLADIPLPDGFDTTALEAGSLRDRYQLGAEVAGAAACAWIDQWATATASDEPTSADAAVLALATARDWDILKEMATEGAFPRVVWQYADAVATDGIIEAGDRVTVQESYEQALGCRPEA